jgi:carboxypeptidase Taq
MALLTPYEQLEQEFSRLHAFRGALAVLRWDAAVTMPRGSSDVRGEQLAALETECHAMLTSPRLTRLLERAEASTAGLRDWQRANLREMRRERDHAIATPPSLVSRLARATARAEAALARGAGAQRLRDAGAGARRGAEADAQPRRDARASTWASIPTMRCSTSTRPACCRPTSTAGSRRCRSGCRRWSPRSSSCRRAARAAHRRPLPASRQRALCVDVMKRLWLSLRPRALRRERADLHGGRPGRHPRHHAFRSADPFTGLLGALHETGQALYDLGLPPEWLDQPVGPGPRHGARGEPVAAARDDRGPQPRLRRTT